MSRRLLLLAICLLPATACADDRLRPAIERVLPLLERASAGSAEQRECYTCHNQGLPILALTEARRRGFHIDEQNLQRQLDHTWQHLQRNRERFTNGEGTGGKADTAGSALWALSAGERPADEATASVAEYLLVWQADDTHWSCSSDRPPSEASDFTTTFLALRGLTAYGVEAQQDRISARTNAARDWLLSTPAQDNEDRVFRLWALDLAKADADAIATAAADLISRQRADGGWSQLDGGDSDAYATATALVALRETESAPIDSDTFRRGIDYLLTTQLDDGSWRVTSRSEPFQTYFETGFPHNKDQFISSAASAWAALALLAALPPADAAAQPAALLSVPFQVRETAGIRRRNDVITVRSTEPRIVEHAGGFRVVRGDQIVPAQVRLVKWPGEPPQLVVDFIDHFRPFESRDYALELTAEPTPAEPTEGLTLTQANDAFRIDSSGLVFWTIPRNLAGLLDFSWKETDYVADDSAGLYFSGRDGKRVLLADRPPSSVGIERTGGLAVGLRFDYADWPPGARSRVHLEFPRTKSWIHATWSIEGDTETAHTIGCELKLRLDGSESLLDFGAGDFVYATVTAQQAARLEAGPRDSGTVPWRVLHGAADALEPIFVAPRDVPTPAVHGWAHVLDDHRATALAIGAFGEATRDLIAADGRGRLTWTRTFDDSTGSATQPRRLEFWLHFVTMPVHIGARTSPRSMQEPLEVHWRPE